MSGAGPESTSRAGRVTRLVTSKWNSEANMVKAIFNGRPNGRTRPSELRLGVKVA